MESLIQLLKINSIIALIFYEHANTCRFIKCVDAKTGIFFFLKVSEKELSIPATYYTLKLDAIDHVPIVENSADYYSSIQLAETKVDELYSMIYLDSKGKRFRTMYEQIGRLGSCFRRLSMRPILEHDNIMCEMRTDFTLNWFSINSCTSHLYTWYIYITYTDFYKEIASNRAVLSTVDTKLKHILDTTHAQYIKTLYTSRFSTLIKDKTREIDSRKVKLQKTIQTHLTALTQHRAKEQQYMTQLTKIEGKKDADIMTTANLNKQLDSIRELSLEKITELLKVTDELKFYYLKSENLLCSTANVLRAWKDTSV